MIKIRKRMALWIRSLLPDFARESESARVIREGCDRAREREMRWWRKNVYLPEGYVIDYIKPLKRGGANAPSNMQWQTTAEAKGRVLNVGLAHYQAKAKDRIE
jgi:hypothetical protein